MPADKRFRQFVRLSAALLLVIIFGTIGYRLIELDWTLLESFYMTIITITTVGFGEVKQLTPNGQIFTVALILVGLGLAAAILARIGQFIIETGIQDIYGRRKMTDRINRLRNHYLLCGFGRTGSSIARKLDESGIEFVVIDSLVDHIESAKKVGYNVLHGDAADDSVLLAAGINRAAGTVLCVGDDATNVNIALAARELNTEQNIVSRGTDPSLEYRLIRAGADSVVYPMRLGGEQIARAIADEHAGKTGGDEGTSSSKLGYDLRVVRNTEGLREVASLLEEYKALRPVAVRRSDGAMVHNPKPADVLGENDSLLLLVNEEKHHRTKQEIRALTWSDDFNLGVPKMDKELKRLFKVAEELQTAVLDNLGKDTVAKRYEMLVTYAGSHFHRQEVMMRENGYPEQEAHQLEHEELSRYLNDLNRDDRLVFEDETWNQLDRWLSKHIMEEDLTFAEYMKSR